MKNESKLKTYQSTKTSRPNKKLSEEQIEKKFEQLYNENQKWKAKKDKMREQRDLAKSLQDLKECSFKPTVNPQNMFEGSSQGSFIKRQIDWLSKKQRKIEQLTKQSDKRLQKQCSFHPSISRKSYAMLHSSSRISNFSRQQQSDNNFRRQLKCSYRQIHMKQQGYKQLQKTNSVYEFNLMTQKRSQLRKQQQKQENNGFNSSLGFQSHRNNKNFNTSSTYRNLFSSISKTDINHEEEGYIENVVIKNQQQDTFNSLSSLQLKTQRKDQHQILTQREQIQILEQQVQQDDDKVNKQQNIVQSVIAIDIPSDEINQNRQEDGQQECNNKQEQCI